jgi:phosphonate transport system substrate-binding protein
MAAFLAIFVVLLGADLACSDGKAQIDFSQPEVVAGASQPPSTGTLTSTLRLAVAPVLSARVTSALYQQLADYLSARLRRPVELVQGKTYAEINDLVKTGDITVALVCTNPYLQGRDDFGMELLAVPEVHGEVVYYALLIVSQNSQASSLRDLRGTSFAFSDPLSNTGRLAPTYQVARLGTSPDAFFGHTIFTYSHDSSVRAVADGVVNGASVDSLVYDYLAATEPELIARVKVIDRWGPFGINPLVVNPHLDEYTKSELRRVFLQMSEDPEGKPILAALEIDRFVVPDDSLYDSVREMRLYLRQRGLAP